MTNNIQKIIIFLLSVVAAATMVAQKKITPVDNDPTKPRQPVLHYYDKHGNPLDEPVLFLADLDTVRNAGPKPIYPLLQSVSIGANFFDGVMLLAGQKHASFDVWAELSLHNWIQPVVEAGIGFADNQPEDGNFHYKGKPSFYGKIGVNYNFLYKSNPDYQMHIGLRAGFTSFSYEITDITINSSYWDQTNHLSILNQKAHASYGEVLGGIKVKIWKNISMGWDFRFKFKFGTPKGSNSQPWFIPGYGTKSPVSASFSLIYTIPLNKGKTIAELELERLNAAPAVPESPSTQGGTADPDSTEEAVDPNDSDVSGAADVE